MAGEYDEKKYISCRNCGCEIEENQRKCPYCKTINLLAPKRSSGIFLFIAVAIVCIAAIGCLLVLIFNHSDNELRAGNIKIYDVVNGSGNTIIGKRAIILVNKEALKSMPTDEYNSFLENEISGSGYNWFTIEFKDGTGIVFAGCDIDSCMYGLIDSDGMLETTKGFINRYKIDGVYSFEYTSK